MKRNTLLYSLLGLVLCAAVIALAMWYKPHRKVEYEQGIAVTAETLFREYAGDEKAADERYLNKTIAVTGTVAELDTNQDGQIVVVLSTGDPAGGIACTLRDKTGVRMREQDVIRLKGICSGRLADVILTDCISIP